MKNTNKRAFTIVELVIVIAIIAILASVFIPTFSGMVKKAKISADTQLAKNMNTALALAEITEGKNETFADAIADIFDAGYSVEKLTPTAEKYNLVWDQDTDRIVFLDDNFKLIYSENDKVNAKTYHLWKVAHKASDMTGGFSFYLADNFRDALPATITTGLDVGNHTDITAINYTNAGSAQDVIIRTNGGTLTVNAPLDTVRHYGIGTTLTVTNIANNSFHEHGKFERAEVFTGRVVVEEEGNIPSFVLGGSTVTIETNSDTAITVADGVIPTENTKVIINNPTAVVAVENGLDSIVTGGNKVEITKVSDYSALIDAIGNNKQYIMLMADISTTTSININYSMTLDGNGHTITSKASSGSSNSKTISLGESNTSVTLLNLTTKDTYTTESRGIQLQKDHINLNIVNSRIEAITYAILFYAGNITNDAKSCNVTIENSQIIAETYAINLYGGYSEGSANDCHITIIDSQVTGWASLNIWSHNLTLEASNSTFSGINKSAENGEGWNDFGTIVLEGDTTENSTAHAENCNLTFNNCKFISIVGKNNQTHIAFNLQSKNNVVILNNCDYDHLDALSYDHGSSNTLHTA